jgi:7-cyano-7-deazaguanine synthase
MGGYRRRYPPIQTGDAMKAVTLLSGGLDSTTLAYHLKDKYDERGIDLIALSFDYGQRHIKELDVAGDMAELLGAEHHIIELAVADSVDDDTEPLASILGGSSLTDSSVPVPDGHYAEESMKQTIVPNRNAIMLSIAYGVAVARGAELVAFAAHSGDHAIYPDCRPDFVYNLNYALKLGNSWADPIPTIDGTFLSMSKADIAKDAVRLGVPIEKTWSCYKGGDLHCGTCGTCTERREAFELAGVTDPTEYASLVKHY